MYVPLSTRKQQRGTLVVTSVMLRHGINCCITIIIIDTLITGSKVQ